MNTEQRIEHFLCLDAIQVTFLTGGKTAPCLISQESSSRKLKRFLQYGCEISFRLRPKALILLLFDGFRRRRRGDLSGNRVSATTVRRTVLDPQGSANNKYQPNIMIES